MKSEHFLGKCWQVLKKFQSNNYKKILIKFGKFCKNSLKFFKKFKNFERFLERNFR